MGYESPNVNLIDSTGNSLPVQPGSAIPASTPALLLAGSDGTNARYLNVDSSGRTVLVGAGTAGTPAGGVISIQGVSGGQAMPISGTITATITSSSATGAATPSSASLAGGAVTTTAPTYTNGNLGALSLTTSGLLRVDASATTITITGSVTGSATDNTANSTAKLPVMVAVAATAAPTWTNGNMVPLSVDTSGALRITGTISATNPSVSTTGAAPPASATYLGGSVTTAVPTYTTGQMNGLSLTTAGALRIDGSGITQPVSGTGNFTVVGATAIGATPSTNPILFAGTDGGGVVRIVRTTSFGGINLAADQTVGGGVPGTAIQVGASDGTNIQALRVTTGTPTGTESALIVKNVPSGTQPVSGTITANAGTGSFTVAQATAANLNATVVQGTAANLRAQTAAEGSTGVAVPTVAAMVGGSDGTNLRALRTATDGTVVITSIDGIKTTYSAAATNFAPPATPTDIFTITGSASKTVRVTKIFVTGTQTTAAVRDVLLIKRSSANTGGTSAAATAVPHDSANAAATATVLSYTINPTALGTAVGTIFSKKVFIPGTGVVQGELILDFGTTNDQAIVLRGTAQVLAVNLNSVTSTGNAVNITIEWTEE